MMSAARRPYEGSRGALRECQEIARHSVQCGYEWNYRVVEVQIDRVVTIKRATCPQYN